MIKKLLLGLMAVLVLSGCEDTVSGVKVEAFHTYKVDQFYLQTSAGTFKVCDKLEEHGDAAVYSIKVEALKDRNPKKLTMCYHNKIIRVDPDLEPVKEPQPPREIVYQVITPRGIFIGAVLEVVAGHVMIVVLVLVSVLLGYRIGRAGR